VRAADGAGPGTAKVSLSFAACEELDIAPATFDIPVVRAAGK
jgi:hypothetical protein